MADDRNHSECPSCGARLKADSVFCHECGSDAETGWREDADLESLDLPAGYGSGDEADGAPARTRRAADPAPTTTRPSRWPLFVVVPALLLLGWMLATTSPQTLLAAPFEVTVPALLLALIAIVWIKKSRRRR